MTQHLTEAVASIDDAITSLRDADTREEAPPAVLALCSIRLRDLRDVLTQWEVQ